MCGVVGVVGRSVSRESINAILSLQDHRGPDARGIYVDPAGSATLGHNRLSIIDLSAAGNQPMSSRDGRYWIVYNGEIYNYLELRSELSAYPFRSRTDTEVILAAYERWGEACLDRFVGMFAFLLWDSLEQRLFAARDRFGVKPLYYTTLPDGALVLASEIKTLRGFGVETSPDDIAWASFLSRGLIDYSPRTFWTSIRQLPAGHTLTWQRGARRESCWYDLADRVPADRDGRPTGKVQEEYRDLLIESVRLRFRSDVPVGINLSGGLDSSLLLGLVQAVRGPESDLKAFTFVTGDERYDELPWVQQMLAHTRHPNIICPLSADDIPGLAESMQLHQDEPFGGFPTIAYGCVFARAREEGVIVLLDGQGMDEQWAGYSYYLGARDGAEVSVVQGSEDRPVRPECLVPEFNALGEQTPSANAFPDRLRQLQYRDIRFTKIPRALRYSDRISMRYSTELREPFLDHRLMELALRQPRDRMIRGDIQKWLPRRIAAELLPGDLVDAPKRPLHTPQREWLRGPLRDWAQAGIEAALKAVGGSWLDRGGVMRQWERFQRGESDNSFYVWQWINLGLMSASPGWRSKESSSVPQA